MGNKDETIQNNGAIHVVARIIKNVVSSAAEAEIAAVFINAKEAVPIRQSLEEMGHPQPPTEIITDNQAAHGILNKSCKQTRSKAIDMNYYWVRDRIEQGQFKLTWKTGAENLADYFTKHHSPAHHKKMRPIYLQIIKYKWAQMAKIENLRGCIDRLKQTQKENRQTLKGSKTKDIQKATSGTTKKALHKHSHKSPTEKLGHNKVPIQTICNFKSEVTYKPCNFKSEVTYKPGLKLDRTASYCTKVSTGKLGLQSLRSKTNTRL